MRFQSLLFLTVWLTGTLSLAGLVPKDSKTVEREEVDPKTCPTVRCAGGYHPVYYPEKTHCVCEPDEVSPDPSTCPLIKCSSTTRPVYHAETKSCSCDPIAPVCPNTIFCAAGCHKVLDSSAEECVCQVTNPIPKTCPQFKCLENNHVVYHPETDKCGCVPDCPDLVCTADQRINYNYNTNSCSCVYIDVLKPSSVKARAEQRDHIIDLPLPTKSGNGFACSDVVCISWEHPVVDETTGKCKCEGMPGFGPISDTPRPTSPTTSPEDPQATPVDITCSDTVCISEQTPRYNATTKDCTCEWIPGFEPIEPFEPSTLPSKRATQTDDPSCSTTMCLLEMQPVYNETIGSCTCAYYDAFKPPIESSSTTATSPGSKPTNPAYGPSCSMSDVYCISEMRPTWNETSAKCECEWIPGLEPIKVPVSVDA